MIGGNQTSESIWEKTRYWVAEISIVFIGVYLAFLFSGYRTEQQNKQKKQQIYTALYNHLSTLEFNAGANEIDSLYVKPFLSAYKKNKMPELKPLPSRIG